MTETAFRSAAPEVMVAYATWDARREEFRASMRNLGDEYGREVYVSRSMLSGQSFSGLKHDRGDDVPDGWRVDSKTRLLKPDKRTKEGKALAAELKRLSLPRPVIPGMPGDCWGEGYVYAPAFFEHDGTVWAGWGCGPDRLTGDGGDMRGPTVDPSLWTLAKLSEWHAAREAVEERAA